MIKLQAGGLQLYQIQALAQVFSCKFCKIFSNTYFEVWLYVLVMSRARFRENPHSIVA